MNLIYMENLMKSYSERKLLDNISFGIDYNDKIGLIGLNGTGKTTLLKIIAGIVKPDNGNIIKGSGVTIEYLPQNIDFDVNATIIEQVFKGNSKNIQLVKRYEEAISNPDTENETILKLTDEMDISNAWELESEAKTVLTKLGIIDFKQKIGKLSGGQRRRVALASALINPADLLILDEPTNHLDNNTIEWLEEYLERRRGALIMITHDRYFLDRIVDKIIELDRGNLYEYNGNYNYYVQKKFEREEIEIASERKRKSLLKQELDWMKQGVRARGTRQKARVERFHELQDNKADLDHEKLDISIGGKRLGKKIIEMNNIEKSFGEKEIIKNFTYTILRDDRVGILGPNGSGKSTLINIIGGKFKPDNGIVDVGETVKIGMFSQETGHMNSETRAIEYIKEGGEFIDTAEGENISASDMMERFLFPKDEQWTPIGNLSGGEKRRLQLLRVLMEGPNLLLLDEPTNDLDIDTLTVLEDYIDEFPGPVIIVSHDRYLLDKTVEKVFAFEDNGEIVSYTGNYAYFKEQEKERKKVKQKKDKPEVKEKKRESHRELKFSYNEQREWDKIDDIILELERKLEEIDSLMRDFATDPEKLEELLGEKEELEKELDEKMERWVYLTEIAEKIEENKK